MSKEYLTVDNKLIMVDGKLVEVPANTELSDVLDAQESEIATTQNEGDKIVDEIVGYVDGSPRGVYASLSALQSAFPSGTQGVYVCTDNGHWYYWSGTAWTDGGVYQSSEDIKTIKNDLSSFSKNIKYDGSYNLLDGVNTTNGKYP